MEQAETEPATRADIGEPEPGDVRSRHIGEALGNREERHFVLFRGEYRALPVASVSIDLLVYRADNGRLMRQLGELRQAEGLPADYFRAHQESREVQQRLHGLLVEMALDPAGPIYAELERQQTQTEPLLVTHDGVVVNGNRRLAAMRELLARDPERYRGFGSVRVSVLPADATVEDIEYVEAALQLTPETKLAYSWINRRLKLRRHRDELGLPVDEIIDAYRLADQAQLDRELAELALAERYLDAYRGEPGRYHLIEDAEDLFVGLNEQLAGLRPADRGLWEAAGFAMIEAREKLDEDLATHHYPFVAPRPDYAPGQAMRRLAADEGLIRASEADETGVLPEDVRADLESLLWRRERAEELAQSVVQHLEQILVEHRQRTAPTRAVHRIRNVRQFLEQLDGRDLSVRHVRAIRSEVASMQQLSRDLAAGEGPREDPSESQHPTDPFHPRLGDALKDLVKVVLGPRLSWRIGEWRARRRGRSE